MKILLLVLNLLWVPVSQAEIAVIVHPDNAAAVNAKDIRNVFLGKVGSFPNGNNAKPITYQEGNQARTRFNLELLRKTDVLYVAFWSKLMFTGAAVPPPELASYKDMVSQIAKDPNSIGYVPVEAVDDSVKVVYTF